ncbi:hypothetical protein M422DRAFT_31331, partial [Sphaerobolus stellatus SS14]
MEARMPSSLPVPSHPSHPSLTLSLLDSTSPYAHQMHERTMRQSLPRSFAI